ncbi:MAG: pseudouridine-5'-phosphate glycosidase [Actinomycetia bacterium]|nr:pseudouridine-5'-phosphate glycosidase [Actinomycetes bacterium]
MPEPTRIHPEVRDALADGRPVVALESVVVTHGLPAPTHLALAREMEQAVREEGAVPATVAVLDGVVRVGLAPSELEALADRPDRRKLSVRDLPVAVGLGQSGGTTVAATALVAHRAGIAAFATGGIGGVHPGAAERLDVSADLPTLARTPIAVVSAGAKSILDLANTLEVLETLSVPVVGFGTDTLPGFHTRTTGLALPARVDDVASLAAVVRARDTLRLPQAVLVVQPVPEADAVPPEEVHRAVAEATERAHAARVHGSALTPFVLAALNDAEGDPRFLRANLSLLRANARLAARLARHLAESDA